MSQPVAVTAVTVQNSGELFSVDAVPPDLVRLQIDAVAADSHLVLDLSGTTFISSAGLSVMLNARRRLDDAGGSLLVGAASATVRRLIELSGLADMLAND